MPYRAPVGSELPQFAHPRSAIDPRVAEIGFRAGEPMLGAGTVINPIIRIITIVAVLAATYLFIVKPVLDTTNSAFEEFGLDAFSDSFEGLPSQIQDQVNEALEQTDGSQRLQQCVERAVDQNRPDQQQINRCVDRFG